MRSALRGDCHVHTDWSDGGDTLPAMIAAAAQAGHDYVVITDHSPRLKIANGLTATRLRQQMEVIAAVNDSLTGTGFRVLRGIEVDILVDGSLDQDPELLAQLDIVVGSVHSELRMDRGAMTRRMVKALENPHLDILGHCTGRKLPVTTDDAHSSARRRPPSSFDVDAVFEAVAANSKALEINCRPDRLDPPSTMLRKAARVDRLLFSIDSDAHAVAQLDWLSYGCERAEAAGLEPERVVNAWSAEELLDWAASHAG
jgi:putative hydrolase